MGLGTARLGRIGAAALRQASRPSGSGLGYAYGQPFGDPSGFDAGTGKEEIDRFNQWLRAQPWHQSFVDATQNRGHGDLTDDERDRLKSLMQQHGIPVTDDMKVDHAGNVTGKSWAQRHPGLVKGLAIGGGAAAALFGIPALAGVLGGGGAGAAGSVAGLAPEIGLGGEGLAAGLGGAGAIGAGTAAGLAPAIGLGGAGLAEGLGGAGAVGAGGAGLGAGGAGLAGLSDVIEGPGNPGGYLDALGGASGGLGGLLKRLLPFASLIPAGINAAKSQSNPMSDLLSSPDMQAVIKEASRRYTGQGDLANSITRQAYEGLPAYARRS